MFNMNPNAAMFQSMYENEQQPQDAEDDKSYGTYSDFHGFGFIQVT